MKKQKKDVFEYAKFATSTGLSTAVSAAAANKTGQNVGMGGFSPIGSMSGVAVTAKMGGGILGTLKKMNKTKKKNRKR